MALNVDKNESTLQDRNCGGGGASDRMDDEIYWKSEVK